MTQRIPGQLAPPPVLARPAPAGSGRWLRVLTRSDLARLVAASAEEILRDRLGLSVPAARRLSRFLVQRFFARARARARRVRALSRGEFLRELEGTQRELLLERTRVESELEGLRQRLEGVRARLESGELAEDEERRLSEELGHDLQALLAGPAADRPALVAGLLQRERERRHAALSRALTSYRERIDVLERRVAKLRASLAQMEEELGALADRAELDRGIASIYREVQGLSLQEAQRQAKLGLLRAIFEANLELQRQRRAA